MTVIQDFIGSIMTYKRYAIYYTPDQGALAQFGAAWLGWDAARGCAVAQPDVAGLPLPLPEVAQTPRRYGFHATIKPPFALATSHEEADLRTAFANWCQDAAPVMLPGLELARLGRFLALVPEGEAPALAVLAARVVRDFDLFRAPLSAAEMQRRRGNGLSQAQEERLQRWGYPHVMDGFRFHMTLTGRLPKAQVTQIAKVLTPLLADLLPVPFTLGALSLMGEDGDGFFHVLARHPLSG